LPQLAGGVEINTHQLSHELLARGHEPAVLARLSLRDMFGAKNLARMALAGHQCCMDRDQGYEVYRARRPWGDLSGLGRADIGVVQNGGMIALARALDRVGVKSVAYLHGLEFLDWHAELQGDEAGLPFCGYIANSDFTARRFRQRWGADATVIPPLIRQELYWTDRVERHVTFINPVPVKGVDLAIQVARLCPEIPFCFVRGWPLRAGALRRLKSAVNELPNVFLRGSAADMRSVYRTTRLLLVPSQWEAETWGRVASEAQVSGIPVVASDRGGLPESVGPGGFILGHQQPAEEWADVVRRLWHDPSLYQLTSSAALAHARRPNLDSDRQVSTFLAVLERSAADTRCHGRS
jgi:glycosyltransferase involved in cell wall biosynthesis